MSRNWTRERSLQVVSRESYSPGAAWPGLYAAPIVKKAVESYSAAFLLSDD